jgi:hypothetical protein
VYFGNVSVPLTERNALMFGDEGTLELARLEREAIIHTHAKMAVQQFGEAFADRRGDGSLLRSPDRRGGPKPSPVVSSYWRFP